MPNFELLQDNNGLRTWKIEAIHATTTGNNRKYTRQELELAARSLSYRPININHDRSRWLKYNPYDPAARNSNSTLELEFDSARNGVVGRMQIVDSKVNEAIESGRLSKVSIEQVPVRGESCSEYCEQHGVIFTGIALLEDGVCPGDPTAKIKLESRTIEIINLGV